MKIFQSFKNILILFFFLGSSAFAQTLNFDSTVIAGIHQIYNIKFNEAESTFRSLIADYPDRPAGRFFLAMIDWWKILLDPDNESYDDIFFQKLEDVIYQCDQILKKDPDNVEALFFKGGAIGFRGRLRAFRESWLKAADDGREALPIVEKAASLDPSNIDVKLGFGIYDYYAAVIPEQNPFLKPLMIFFPSGDKVKGIEELKETAEKGKYAKYEARYFLMTLFYDYENNPFAADVFAKELTKDFPDNPTFERWEGRISVKKGDYASAFKIFRDVLKKGEMNYTGYNFPAVKREAVYYVGLQYKNLHQLDSAKYFFNQCAELSKQIEKGEKESGFLINSYLYLGMINDLQGNRNEAIQYYKDLLDMREYGRSHSLAKNYIDKPYKE
jgi:tetratricopeptide (TPR) repeat protein